MIQLVQYRTHQSVDELKATEKAQIQKHKLADNVKKVYGCLVKHSFNGLGACKLKGQTIADELGISRSTVTRIIKKLRDLNIIESHAETKSNGIKGANVYSIIFLSQGEPTNAPTEMTQRAVHETPRSSKVEHANHESESFNSFNLSSNPFVNNVNAYSAHDKSHDLKQQLRKIYQPRDEEAFEELCKIAFGQLKKYMRSHNVPYLQMSQIVTKCMRDLKRKRDVRNEPAMYSAMIKRQTLQLFEQFIAPKRAGIKIGVVPGWLKTEKERQQEQPEQQVVQDDEAFLERKRKLEERMKIDNDVRAKLLQELGMN